MTRGPISPADYGEGMDDAELAAEGWAVGLDVWGPVEKAYSEFVGDMTLANSQLYSLAEAIRAEGLAGIVSELERVHADRNGYCNTCGGQYPCLTLRIARGGPTT